MVRLAALGLRFQKKGAIDDNLFACAKSREDFNFTGQVPSTPNTPDFKPALDLWKEDAPVAPDSLDGRDGHAQDGSTWRANREHRGRTHARSQHPTPVLDVDADGNRPRLRFASLPGQGH